MHKSPIPLIHEHHFRAMGSQFGLWLEHDDADVAEAVLNQAQSTIAAAERQMTRFDPDSELSQLNAHTGEWMPVSRLLWRVIARALQLAEDTAGLFDPTIGAAVLANGYRQSFDSMARRGSGSQPTASMPLLGQWRAVERDGARHAVRLPHGVRLDLGGIGKGFMAQQVVDFLSLWGPCLVDAGGDIVAGDAPAGQPGWPVGIARPAQAGAEQPVFDVWLTNAALATSGSDYRWWLQDGQRRHHLIDPRTGLSAVSDVVSASILAADASSAEAWATAMLIAGSERGMAGARERQMPAVLHTVAGQTKMSPAMERFVIQSTVVAVATA